MPKTIIKFDDAVEKYLDCFYRRGELFDETPEAPVVNYTKEIFNMLYSRMGYIESITPVYSPSAELTIVIYLKLEDEEAFEKFEELNKAGWDAVEEKHKLEEYWFWRFVNELRDDAGHLIKVWPCDSTRNEFVMVIKESL